VVKELCDAGSTITDTVSKQVLGVCVCANRYAPTDHNNAANRRKSDSYKRHVTAAAIHDSSAAFKDSFSSRACETLSQLAAAAAAAAAAAEAVKPALELRRMRSARHPWNRQTPLLT